MTTEQKKLKHAVKRPGFTHEFTVNYLFLLFQLASLSLVFLSVNVV